MWWIVAIVLTAIALVGVVVWKKGRPFAAGDVFLASRLSRGNRLFPTQVAITSSTVVQYTPRWIGRQEESIHLAHVASVKIDTGAILSDVLIETTGGVDPIRCHGHSKRDAVRMKALIEEHQNSYYRQTGQLPGASVGSDPPSR